MNIAQIKKAVLAAVTVNIITLAAIQAGGESCKPNAQGMCVLPKKPAVAEKAAEPAWTAKLAGEFVSLCEQLVVKAKEAGKRLKYSRLLIEQCGLKMEWDAFCNDYQTKQLCVPYTKKTVFSCSEEES